MRASVNPARIQKYAVNTAIWLFVRDPETLDEVEREDLVAFCQVSPTLKQAYVLVQDFLSMVHKREGARLDAWLEKIAESGLAELQSFASGIEKDKDAVQAGLTWPINNGVVEGNVTKLKRDFASNVWKSRISPPASTSAPRIVAAGESRPRLADVIKPQVGDA